MADVTAVRKLISKVKPDVIFHLSGMVGAAPDPEFVLPTFHTLLMSTVNLLTATKEIGCRRIVLVASLTEPRPSHAEVTPSSPYAAAKWAGSAYGRMFYALYGTPTVIVRPYMVYGPGQDSRKLIPSVILSLLRGEPPKLSSGRWEADWIYIDDVIDGFLAAALASQVEGTTIDLGSGVLVKVCTVVQGLVEATGSDLQPLFGALPDRPFEQVRAADTNAAYLSLGWKSSTSLESGLQRTVTWYKSQLDESSSSKPLARLLPPKLKSVHRIE